MDMTLHYQYMIISISLTSHFFKTYIIFAIRFKDLSFCTIIVVLLGLIYILFSYLCLLFFHGGNKRYVHGPRHASIYYTPSILLSTFLMVFKHLQSQDLLS